jgi:glycine betaine/proline transport system substrate-binding protein
MLLIGAGVAAAALTLAGPATAGDIPESPDPIKLAVNEWTGQHITTHIAGEILKRMGYNVEYVTAGSYPQATAIADGSLAATLEIWDNNMGDIFPKELAAGRIEPIGDAGLDPVEGWLYPDYVEAQCPGLPNWVALKNCAEVFATTDTLPDGRFLDYPADWGDRGAKMIKALGLPFQAVPSGGEGNLVAEYKAAVAKKEPIVLMFWAPHWMFAEVEGKWVEFPKFEQACYDDPAWGLNAGETHDCGLAAPRTQKFAWPGMKDKWPAAYRFLKNYRIRNETQIPLMKAVDVDGKKLEDVVKAWVDENEAVWKPWVDAAIM